MSGFEPKAYGAYPAFEFVANELEGRLALLLADLGVTVKLPNLHGGST